MGWIAIASLAQVSAWCQFDLQIDRLREGYKRAIDEIRGPIAKNGLLGQNPEILAKKNVTLLNSNHVPATTGQCCPKEKVPFFQIINGEIPFWGCLYSEKRSFGHLFPFRP